MVRRETNIIYVLLLVVVRVSSPSFIVCTHTPSICSRRLSPHYPATTLTSCRFTLLSHNFTPFSFVSSLFSFLPVGHLAVALMVSIDYSLHHPLDRSITSNTASIAMQCMPHGFTLRYSKAIVASCICRYVFVIVCTIDVLAQHLNPCGFHLELRTHFSG